MVVHGFDHVEPGVAAGLADAEHQVQVLAALLEGKGVFNVGGGAQRAGDVQVHVPVVGGAGALLHAAQTVLVDGHFGHLVAAQLGAAGQIDNLRVLGSHEVGKVLAVGIQCQIHMELGVVAAEQLRRAERIVDQRFTAENFQVFVLEAFAACAAANGDEQTIHVISLPTSVVIPAMPVPGDCSWPGHPPAHSPQNIPSPAHSGG